jgi:formiminotetrahydrofolate cyclodeaminase
LTGFEIPVNIPVMKKFQDHTLSEYCEVLSQKLPTPGGGSAAALSAALGAALISMVVNYSLGKKTPDIDVKLTEILVKSEKLRKRFLELVDLDAEAYLAFIKARKADEKTREEAKKRACDVPLEIAKLCYEAIDLTPYLVLEGNKFLVSDVEVALELLGAAFKSAMFNVRINQS